MEKSKINMLYYEQLRNVPKEAIKPIAAGRLKGMSDINPMWRIKAMTQAFGPCGIGWKYEIVNQWQEQYGNEVKSFTIVNLYIKVNGEWSDAIPGTGGATIVEVNSKGMYVNDEGHKMSLTDALSVAMKALGVAADIYFEKDAKYDTKYDNIPTQDATQKETFTDELLKEINAVQTLDELNKIYYKHQSLQKDSNFLAALTKRKGELK